jgi:hypothetical protein
MRWKPGMPASSSQSRNPLSELEAATGDEIEWTRPRRRRPRKGWYFGALGLERWFRFVAVQDRSRCGATPRRQVYGVLGRDEVVEAKAGIVLKIGGQ